MTPEHAGLRHLIPFLLPLAGCDTLLGPGDDGDGDAPPQITQLPRELSPGETEVLRASNRFGLNLLATILDDAPEETHFLSPLSWRPRQRRRTDWSCGRQGDRRQPHWSVRPGPG